MDLVCGLCMKGSYALRVKAWVISCLRVATR